MRSPSRCSKLAASPHRTLRGHIRRSLGRRLLLHVADVMRTGDAAPGGRPARRSPRAWSRCREKGLGMCVVVDEADARRVHRRRPAPRARWPSRCAQNSDACRDELDLQGGGATELAAEAAHLMENFRITALPVVASTADPRLVGRAQRARSVARRSDVAWSGERQARFEVALRRIRLLVLDVDGVLTDGRFFTSPQGRTAQGVPCA